MSLRTCGHHSRAVISWDTEPPCSLGTDGDVRFLGGPTCAAANLAEAPRLPLTCTMTSLDPRRTTTLLAKQFRKTYRRTRRIGEYRHHVMSKVRCSSGAKDLRFMGRHSPFCPKLWIASLPGPPAGMHRRPSIQHAVPKEFDTIAFQRPPDLLLQIDRPPYVLVRHNSFPPLLWPQR